MSNTSVSLRSWLVLAALGLVWGSSFILIKKSLLALGPLEVACGRITISAISFAPILWYHRKQVDWSRWYVFLAVGITGSGLPAFCYAIAQTRVESSLSGMLNSLTPIFALIIGVLFFGAVLSRYKVIGVILGFTGVSMLIMANNGTIDGELFYIGLIIVGTLCYGTSVNMVKHFFQSTKSIVISATSFCLIGPPAIIYLAATTSLSELASRPDIAYSIGALSILAVTGTVMATIFFYRLVQDTDAVFASSVAYLIPIIALLWGVVDGESLSFWHFVGMVIILIGVYLTKRKG